MIRCEVVQFTSGYWYAFVERPDRPEKDGWRESAQTVGPCHSMKECVKAAIEKANPIPTHWCYISNKSASRRELSILMHLYGEEHALKRAK